MNIAIGVALALSVSTLGGAGRPAPLSADDWLDAFNRGDVALAVQVWRRLADIVSVCPCRLDSSAEARSFSFWSCLLARRWSLESCSDVCRARRSASAAAFNPVIAEP